MPQVHRETKVNEPATPLSFAPDIYIPLLSGRPVLIRWLIISLSFLLLTTRPACPLSTPAFGSSVHSHSSFHLSLCHSLHTPQVSWPGVIPLAFLFGQSFTSVPLGRLLPVPFPLVQSPPVPVPVCPLILTATAFWNLISGFSFIWWP